MPSDPNLYTNPYVTLHCGNAKLLTQDLEDNTIDLIFTDPPYCKKDLPIFLWLAKESSRVLSTSGFLLTYCGSLYKDRVMLTLGSHLSFFYDFVVYNKGKSPMLWCRRIISRTKSILAYRQNGSTSLPNTQVLGLWRGGGKDKRFHPWGQDESTTRYFIDVFSNEGDLVLDPFVGGGTTPFICMKLLRHFIGYEKDPSSYQIAVDRLSNTKPHPKCHQFDLLPDQHLPGPLLHGSRVS